MKEYPDLVEKTVSSKYKFKGNIINLRFDEITLPDGNRATREVVEHSGGVCVAALNGDNRLLLVKQFRYPYTQVVTELPAGKLTAGEDPLECAKRELKEETGVSAAKYTCLGYMYPSPGYCGEIIHMYMATDLTFGEACPDEDEFLHVESVPLDDAVSMIMNGEIPDAKTQIAVLKTAKLISGK